MSNLLIIFILSSSLFFSSFENIKIKFDPNNLRLTSKPERITKLLESLLKTENFNLLIRIIKTEASDFIIPYCNTWKSAKNSDLIFKIWNGYYSGIITKEMIKEILLPECVAKSFHTILNLSTQMINVLPHSLLQVREFPFQLLMSSVLEFVVKKAIYTKPQDPKIKWSSWIASEEREFNQCPESPIYYKYGWQQISPQEFQNFSDLKADCLIRWLLLESDSNFLKISDEEVLMRTLTLISWKSKTSILSKRINQRALKSDCISLIEDILSNEPNWNLNLLFKVVNFLNPKLILIGDWFIGILSLWQSVLSSLTTVDDLRIIDKILQFTLFTLQPTFQGVTKLPELFNPSIRPFIERQVYERFKNQIKSFHREYPTFFEHEFTLIPLNIRLTSFLRKKRVFSSYQGRFLLKSEYDMETFKLFGSKEFLLFISDKFRNGVFGLSRTSLNPAQFSFAGKLLSFKSLTRLFLLSVSEMSEWFKKIRINNKDFVIPTPYCPDLFWELLGYFLIQARILNLNINLIIEKEFFLEMMTPTPTKSFEYIKSLSESYNEQNQKEIKILSSNFANRFTVASITSISDSSFDADEPLIDCRSLVFQIYRKGMKFMKEGIDYVLEPAKLTSEELYNFIYNK